MRAGAEALVVDVSVGAPVYYDDGDSRTLVTIVAVDRSDTSVTVAFDDGRSIIDFIGTGISLEFVDGLVRRTESSKGESCTRASRAKSCAGLGPFGLQRFR